MAVGEDALSYFLEEATKGVPDDLANQLRSGLRRQYGNPATEGVHRALKLSERPSDGDVQRLLFNPDPEVDPQRYPALLLPEGQRELDMQEDPRGRIQMQAMTSLYLVHCSRWEDFGRRFVLAGGLRALAALLDHPSLQFRGQAVETFHKVGILRWCVVANRCDSLI